MKRVFSVFSSILLIVLILLAVVIAGPLLVGYKEMAVLSGSMEPGIPVGSVVYVKTSIDPQTLSNGDIVTYSSGDIYVTHRVQSIDKNAGTLVTKGDANEVADGDISFSQVYGKAVFHLPYLGYISMWIHKPAGIMAVTGLVVLVIVLNFLPYLLTPDKKDEKTGEVSSEEYKDKS